MILEFISCDHLSFINQFGKDEVNPIFVKKKKPNIITFKIKNGKIF